MKKLVTFILLIIAWGGVHAEDAVLIGDFYYTLNADNKTAIVLAKDVPVLPNLYILAACETLDTTPTPIAPANAEPATCLMSIFLADSKSDCPLSIFTPTCRATSAAPETAAPTTTYTHFPLGSLYFNGLFRPYAYGVIQG